MNNEDIINSLKQYSRKISNIEKKEKEAGYEYSKIPNLKIPWAYAENKNIVHASEGIKKEHYYCISCKEKVILRKGEIKQPHFSHISDSTCEPESACHKICKTLILNSIKQNAENDKSLKLTTNCFGCSETFTREINGGYFKSGEQEVGIKKYKCDVVAETIKSSKLAIEVYHTHETDIVKKIKIGIPFIEITTENILDDPFHWISYDFRMNCNFCKKCIDHYMEIIKICDFYQIDRRTYTPLNIPYYRSFSYFADKIICYRCKSIIPVFIKNHHFIGNSLIPKTIKLVKTPKCPDGYFSNTCPCCGVIQGENHILKETTHISLLEDLKYTMSYKHFGLMKNKQQELDRYHFKLMNSISY